MIFLVDNYDSFTYNLYQYLSETGREVMVRRNDDFTLKYLERIKPSCIIISPGPGVPGKAGMSEKVIEKFAGLIPVFGVCLGHQAIAEVFGGKIVRAKHLMHGKCDEIYHDGTGIYVGVSSPFTATRYHSLIVSRSGLPKCFKITGWTVKNEIMGISHIEYPLHGVQFHPESVMTVEGKKILFNFLKTTGEEKPRR